MRRNRGIEYLNHIRDQVSSEFTNNNLEVQQGRMVIESRLSAMGTANSANSTETQRRIGQMNETIEGHSKLMCKIIWRLEVVGVMVAIGLIVLIWNIVSH